MKRGFDRPSTSDMIATAATESTDERIRMNGLILDSTKPSLILFLSESPSYQSQSRHLDNFGPVSHPRQTLCVYNPILLSCKQLVPPTKQKVPCNELEPRGERVAYISSIRTVCRSASTVCIPSSSNIACSSALSTYLWSRISLVFGVTVTSAVKKRI